MLKLRRFPLLSEKKRPDFADHGMIEANDRNTKHAVGIAETWSRDTQEQWILAMVGPRSGLVLTNRKGEMLRFATVASHPDKPRAQQATAKILDMFGFGDKEIVNQTLSKEGDVTYYMRTGSLGESPASRTTVTA